jgi:hypothetical protein
MSSHKRDLASKLNVDVYSSNKLLQKHLNSVAWAAEPGYRGRRASLRPVTGSLPQAGTFVRLPTRRSRISMGTMLDTCVRGGH